MLIKAQTTQKFRYQNRHDSRLVKHIRDISLIALLVPPSLSLLLIHLLSVSLGLLLNKLDANSLDGLSNIAATADEDLGALIPQLEQVFAVVRHSVLDILAAKRLVRGARVSLAHLDGAKLLPPLEFFGIQIVHVGRAASVEEQGGRKLAARGNHGGALLDEASERSQAGARADEDQRSVFGIGWEVEGFGLADGNVQSLTRGERGQEVRGHSEVRTLAGQRWLFENGVGKSEFGGIRQRRRGNGAVKYVRQYIDIIWIRLNLLLADTHGWKHG